MDETQSPAAGRAARISAPDALDDIRRPQLADQVVGRLRALIAQGAVAPGERLPPEATLAREFGVGRSTIREALRMLNHLGLVKTRAGSGSYVTGQLPGHPPSTLSSDELQELFEFRFILESRIAAMAAEHRSTGQLAEILFRLEQIHLAAEGEDRDQAVGAIWSFHQSVAAASGNRFLTEAYRQHQPLFEEGTIVLLGMQPAMHVADVHDELARAIVAKDPGSATTAVRRTFDEIRMRVALLAD
ncbi:FadR/GntR family transcriptional regulator [Microbacterium sp. RD1]|uniref:FadR/GntR family transcriptional regulator n=1 Tax=Microbacterium sp. RD1 TaxID=3457313 RepID=UPI003FA5C247